jgi:AcrR family transcriptional regulator
MGDAACRGVVTVVPAAPEKRRYDSSLRREQAAQTRLRIVDAGAELVHSFSSWDWRELTIRAVAERARVHERTVYRHFPAEQHLRAAVLARLEQEAGIDPYGVTLEGIGDHVQQLFGYLSTFTSSNEPPMDSALEDEDRRRKDGLVAAIRTAAPEWSDRDRTMAAALIDVLAGVASYRRLVSGWQLEPDDATMAASWLIGLLAREVREDRPPSGAASLPKCASPGSPPPARSRSASSKGRGRTPPTSSSPSPPGTRSRRSS